MRTQDESCNMTEHKIEVEKENAAPVCNVETDKKIIEAVSHISTEKNSDSKHVAKEANEANDDR